MMQGIHQAQAECEFEWSGREDGVFVMDRYWLVERRKLPHGVLGLFGHPGAFWHFIHQPIQ